MPDRNYLRRHRALTGSSQYGPMYSKLLKRDRVLIDDLVQRGAGRQARAELKDLDASRREAVRKRSARRRKVDKFDALPDEERTREAGLEINEDGDKAFWDMYKNRRAA